MALDDQNDVPRALEMVEAPLKHMLTYETTKGSLLVLRATWFGVGFSDPTLDTGNTDAVTYQLSRIQTEMGGRPWPEAAMDEIRDLAERAAARGIPVTFVNPPLHPRTLAMLDEAFSERLKRYRAFFAGDCLLDFTGQVLEGRWKPEMYSDAVHLESEYKPALAKALAAAVSDDSACRRTGGGSMTKSMPSDATRR